MSEKVVYYLVMVSVVNDDGDRINSYCGYEQGKIHEFTSDEAERFDSFEEAEQFAQFVKKCFESRDPRLWVEEVVHRYDVTTELTEVCK